MRVEATNETKQTEQLAYRGNISKFPIICGFIIGIFLLMIFSTLRDINKTKDTIATQKQTIADYQAQETKYEEEIKKETDIEILESEDPVLARRKADDEFADTMFNVLLNWDDLEDYNNARTVMISLYQVPENSVLLTQMLPAVTAESYTNENMHLIGSKTYEVTNDGNGVIRYFALCRVSTNIGGTMNRGTVGVFYTINNDGNITDIEAYPMENH